MTTVEEIFEQEWDRYQRSSNPLLLNSGNISSLSTWTSLGNISQPINDFSLPDSIQKGITTLDNHSLRFLAAILCLYRPKTEQALQDITIVVLQKFGSIATTEEEANHIWDTYREPLLSNYKSVTREIINAGYKKYDLSSHSLKVSDNLTLTLNHEAFVELYGSFDPIGYPELAIDYLKALQEIERRLLWNRQVDESYLQYCGKDWRSKPRAIAFFIYEMHIRGKLTPGFIDSKKSIICYVENKFDDQSGQTVYEALKCKRGVFNDFNTNKDKYDQDYNYGLKLFNDEFPDS